VGADRPGTAVSIACDAPRPGSSRSWIAARSYS
jgi:hypothetical protein